MRRTRILLGLTGAAFLAALVAHLGPATLAAQLRMLGWSLPVLFLLGLVKVGLRTWSWSLALQAEGVQAGGGRLLGINVASQTMGYLSVMGPAVAEPMKPLLLRNTVAPEASAPATLADTFLYWFTSAWIGMAGMLAGIGFLARGPQALTGWFAGAAAFAAAMALLWRRKPLVPGLRRLLGRRAAPPHRLDGWLRQAETIEDRVRSFRLRHPGAVRRMFVLDLLVQAALAAEVLVVMAALGVHIGLVRLLAVEAANRLVKIFSAYVPARLGADEGGAAGSFLLLGLDPAAGLTLALARRAQALIWALVGIVWLSLTQAVAVPRGRPVVQKGVL